MSAFFLSRSQSSFSQDALHPVCRIANHLSRTWVAPDTVLNTFPSISQFSQLLYMVGTIINLILETRKLRVREVKYLVQDHTANKWWS